MDEIYNGGSPQGNRNQSWTSRKMDYIDAANGLLSGGQFKVAVCILQHANQRTEQAFPSQETIALRTRLSVPTVKRHVGALRRKGWVKVHVIWKDGKPHNVSPSAGTTFRQGSTISPSSGSRKSRPPLISFCLMLLPFEGVPSLKVLCVSKLIPTKVSKLIPINRRQNE
jgi:hypothetical protein